MTTQTLIPFKAKFIIAVNTTMKDFFKNPDEISLKEKFIKVADKLGNVDIAKLINYNHLGSNMYDEYKHLHLKYNQVFDVSPSNMLVDDEDFSLSFKLQSSEVEVLQIIDEKVTFSNSLNEVHTVETHDNLKLIKV